MRRAVYICVAAAICAALQPAVQAQTAGLPSFEVASVKRSLPTEPSESNFPLGPGDAYSPNGGYLSATNLPAMVYLYFAYKVTGTQARALRAQLPEWVANEHYSIQARASGNPTKDEMRLMMRSLLAERFKLAIRSETREIPVAALVVARQGKLGPQLRVHPDDEPCPLDAPPNQDTPDGRFPLLCGGLVGRPPTTPGRIRFGGRNVTIAFLAASLSAGTTSNRPLVDRTGLEGRFDFNLEWTSEVAGARGPNPAEPSPEQSGPSFEQALREQLGLKVESQKAPVAVLVVDHIERPTGN